MPYLTQTWSAYKPHFKTILHLGYPILVGQMGFMLIVLTDVVMVGHFSSLALAASALGNGVFYAALFALGGFTFALKPPVAEADALNDKQCLTSLLGHGFLLFGGMSLLTLAFFLAFVPNADWILAAQRPEVVAAAKPYMNYLAFSCVPYLLYHTLEQFVEGLSRTKISMVANVAGNVVHLFLNYALIFGELGFPQMGLEGAGISTLVSRTVIFLTFLAYIIFSKDLVIYVRQLAVFRLEKSVFLRLLRLGVPIAMQMLFEVMTFSACMLMSGHIGKIELAAHQIVLNVSIITYLVAASFGQSATIVLARLAAQGQEKALRYAGNIALAWVVLLMVIFGVLIMIFKTFIPLMYLDVQDINFHEIHWLATALMFIMALYQVADGAQVLLLGILRGLQDVRVPTYLTLFSYWVVGIPMAYCLAFWLDMGVYGVWWGLCLGLMLSASLLFWRSQRLYKQRERLISH